MVAEKDLKRGAWYRDTEYPDREIYYKYEMFHENTHWFRYYNEFNGIILSGTGTLPIVNLDKMVREDAPKGYIQDPPPPARFLKRGDLVVRKPSSIDKGVGWVYEVGRHAITRTGGSSPEFSDHGMMVRIVWSNMDGGLLDATATSVWTAAGLLFVERNPSGHKLHSVRMDGLVDGEIKEKTHEEMLQIT